MNPASYLLTNRLEWITLDGRVQLCPLDNCKAVCFSSENSKADLFTEHNLFERRPRVPGLWTRFSFRDGAVLDGILSHNLLDWPDAGYLIVPPQARASRQKVFIPREALAGTELRGVVGGARPSFKTPAARRTPDGEHQLSIFEP